MQTKKGEKKKMKYYMVFDTLCNWYLLCTYDITNNNLGEVFYFEITEEEFNTNLNFCKYGGKNDKERN